MFVLAILTKLTYIKTGQAFCLSNVKVIRVEVSNLILTLIITLLCIVYVLCMWGLYGELSFLHSILLYYYLKLVIPIYNF